MNKKGITPIIAVVLLLMMTVAAAGAAFYWLTRMQQQAQAGVTGAQQQLIEEASASMSLLSQNCNSSQIHVDVMNTGGRTISVAAADIIAVLEDGDGNSICASGPINNAATFNCAGCTGSLSPNSAIRLEIALGAGCSAEMNSGWTYYYQLRFQRGATVSGSFTA